MKTDVEKIVSAERKILTFTLNNQIFGIDMEPLIEIREWEEPTPLPGVPAFIRGVTNLRGFVLPIVDLSERLGWATTMPHARSCIVVVDLGGQSAGFLVDQVADIIPIREEDIKPAPDIEIGEQGVISGLVEVEALASAGGAGMVTLLDLNALGVTRDLELAA